MRSSPANASLTCVPIDAICTSGAAISPTKKTYMTKSPSVIVPARIDRPPMMIMSTPITPEITAVPAPTADVPVIVFATLRNSLCDPAREHELARAARRCRPSRVRTPPIVSASRPVTSALIAPRSRNSGRSRLNAVVIIPPNASSTTSVALVSFQFR